MSRIAALALMLLMSLFPSTALRVCATLRPAVPRCAGAAMGFNTIEELDLAISNHLVCAANSAALYTSSSDTLARTHARTRTPHAHAQNARTHARHAQATLNSTELSDPTWPSPLGYATLAAKRRADLAEGCMQYGGYLAVSERLGVRVRTSASKPTAAPTNRAAAGGAAETTSIGSVGLAGKEEKVAAQLVELRNRPPTPTQSDGAGAAAAGGDAAGSEGARRATYRPRDMIEVRGVTRGAAEQDAPEERGGGSSFLRLDGLQRACALALVFLCAAGFGRSSAEVLDSGPLYLPCTFPVPSLYLPGTFPVPSLYLPRRGARFRPPVPSLYLPCTFPVPSLYLPCTEVLDSGPLSSIQLGAAATCVAHAGIAGFGAFLAAGATERVGSPAAWFLKLALTGAGGFAELRSALAERPQKE